MLAYGEHVFERERLEIETVAGVVVGRNRLWIAVDHDGLVTILTQRVTGVAATVIELNSLPYAVRTGTKNDYFFLRGGRGLVFVFVSGIQIRRVAFELGGAGIDSFVHRLQSVLLAEVTNFFLTAFSIQTPGSGETSVGEAHTLGFAKHRGRDRFHRMLFQLKLHVVNFFELIEKPRVNRCHLRDLFDGETLAKRVLDISQTLGMRRDQALCKNLGFNLLGANTFACIERANSFLKCFFKRAADGHHFADRLHLRSQRFVGAGKFFELPLRNLDDYVIERGLEAGWSLARDVVRNLVERVANGEFGRNFCNRKTGCLPRPRG